MCREPCTNPDVRPGTCDVISGLAHLIGFARSSLIADDLSNHGWPTGSGVQRKMTADTENRPLVTVDNSTLYMCRVRMTFINNLLCFIVEHLRIRDQRLLHSVKQSNPLKFQNI